MGGEETKGTKFSRACICASRETSANNHPWKYPFTRWLAISTLGHSGGGPPHDAGAYTLAPKNLLVWFERQIPSP